MLKSEIHCLQFHALSTKVFSDCISFSCSPEKVGRNNVHCTKFLFILLVIRIIIIVVIIITYEMYTYWNVGQRM